MQRPQLPGPPHFHTFEVRMPGRSPSRVSAVLRVVGVGVAIAALVLGGWALSRRTADRDSAGRVPTTGVLTVQADAGAAAEGSGLRPLSGEVAVLVPGEQSWVNIPWTTDTPVCGVSVTLAADGATVDYPWTTRAFSSFYREDRLAVSASDYTAVRVELPASTTASTVRADVTATFTTGEGATAGSCTGRHTSRTYRVTLPVGA